MQWKAVRLIASFPDRIPAQPKKKAPMMRPIGSVNKSGMNWMVVSESVHEMVERINP